MLPIKNFKRMIKVKADLTVCLVGLRESQLFLVPRTNPIETVAKIFFNF